MVNRDTTLEAESKYMPQSKRRFEKVEKESSVAEQQGMRSYQKQENIPLKAGVVSKSRKQKDLWAIAG